MVIAYFKVLSQPQDSFGGTEKGDKKERGKRLSQISQS